MREVGLCTSFEILHECLVLAIEWSSESLAATSNQTTVQSQKKGKGRAPEDHGGERSSTSPQSRSEWL